MPPRGDRAGVLILREGRLLLIHRRKGGESYDAVPGGTVEPGEIPEITAVREIHEETGLRVRVVGPVITFRNQGRREVYFDASEAEGTAVLGGPEARRNSPENRYRLGWVPLADLAERPLRPERLRTWLVARDWTRFPGR